MGTLRTLIVGDRFLKRLALRSQDAAEEEIPMLRTPCLWLGGATNQLRRHSLREESLKLLDWHYFWLLPQAPIESLQAGDRVLTGVKDESEANSQVDPATWRLYVLELSGDQQRAGMLELLRPASWLLSVKACPEIKPGTGRVVLMKSTTRYTGELATVKFIGSAEAITGTFGHPVYSLDREAEGGYIPLGELKLGERVRAADGWATVESLSRTWGAGSPVYNIEVEAEHRYLVGELRVDCHNAGPGKKCGLRRPYVRNDTRKPVEDSAPRTADGRAIDPNTKMPIDGKPDLGHKPGNENWRERDAAEAEGLNQKEFNDRMNDPAKYQLEDPKSNRSHKFEKKK